MNKQFDVVIGNPPYNKDMYLGFCENAFSLLKPDGVMVQITPAKFYGKGGKANEHFREVIMPHIDEVHLYKCCTDVFDIAERGGIAYWRATKDKTFDTKEIYNHNKNASLDDTRGGQAHTHIEQPVQFMPLKCLELIQKVSSISNNNHLFDNWHLGPCHYCSSTAQGHDKRHDDDLTFMSGRGNKLTQEGWISRSELRRTENIDKYKVVHNVMMTSGKGLSCDITGMYNGVSSTFFVGPGQIIKGSYVVAKFCDSELEAKSFLSFVDSQLVSFIATCSATVTYYCNESMRHVPALPAPYKFDHIYTNDEIFDIFQLTPDERKLITSLIKERKQKEVTL